jgi:hypothetical protein
MMLFVVALLTVFFIPFGQMLGKLFNEHPRPLRGYGVNLAGGLAGIWLFNALSLVSLPPSVWFAVGGLGCLPLVRGRRWHVVLAGLLLVLSVMMLHDSRTVERWTVWSPYQKLTVLPESSWLGQRWAQHGYEIHANSMPYMQITDYSPEFVSQFPEAFPSDEVPYDHYNIPYRFAGSLENVLIVGAGAGND